MTLGSRRWKGLRSRFVSLPGMRNLVGLPSEPEPDPLLFMALRSSRSVAELRSSRSVTELRSSRSGTERSLRERRSLCPRSLIKPLILSPSRSWTRFLQNRQNIKSYMGQCNRQLCCRVKQRSEPLKKQSNGRNNFAFARKQVP
jgi:hypothetical protein